MICSGCVGEIGANRCLVDLELVLLWEMRQKLVKTAAKARSLTC